MARVLVIGGGLAGCTAALELAKNNLDVTIIEKTDTLGGKVRNFGCKSVTSCTGCGLCLVGDLWNKVLHHDKIQIRTESQVNDVIGVKDDFKVVINSKKGVETLIDINSIIVTIGFKEFSSLSDGGLEFEATSGIITGSQLEKVLSDRGQNIFERPLKNAAFIQCYGSRDVKEKAPYCSRVCCGYSTRAARVLKKYFPDIKITMFYMDLQQVEQGEYFDLLQNEDISFVKCRPVKIKSGLPSTVLYEKPGEDQLVKEEFDLVVLSEGIHPASDSAKIAEICTLGFDKNGFLKTVKDGKTTGIYVAGCAAGPKKIQEVSTESQSIAREICGGVL